MPANWSSENDWDQEEDSSGFVHESIANTDNDDASELKQGYSYSSPHPLNTAPPYPLTVIDSFEEPQEWSVTNDVGGSSGIISTTEARTGSNALNAGEGSNPDGVDLYATYSSAQHTSAKITNYYQCGNGDYWNSGGIFREQFNGDAIGVYFDLTAGSGQFRIAEKSSGSWSTLDSVSISESITAEQYNTIVVELQGDGSNVTGVGVVNGNTYTTNTVTTSITSEGAMGVGQIIPSNTGGTNEWDDVTIDYSN